MSPVALGLDILLIGLLLTALALGLRLNKRLKALRAGQASFVTAVGELNQAAARAEGALVALKAASENAHDVLLTRIETARALALKLEAAAAAAETARAVAKTASLQPAPPLAPQRAEGRLDPRFRELEQRLSARRSSMSGGADDDLFEAAEPLRTGSLRR
jgi:hypothetical protein